MTPTAEAYTLSQAAALITRAVASVPAQMWIVAETADVRSSGGHCYLELIEKDAAGRTVARIRATIWASTFYKLAAYFRHVTGQDFRSDIKVMVQATANFHPVYGMALNIVNIRPEYTIGDAALRRQEILKRLKDNGIIESNRLLGWPLPTQRIAVISAEGAAGYGDFMHHLLLNPYRLRYKVRLFPAIMQGERAAASIIEALEQINTEADQWDCVAIVRGGGATSDLAAFDDYALAENVANFPLPVVSGIGHDRDRSILDYVAAQSVKTPTDAAQWLVQLGAEALAELQQLGQNILQTVTDRLSGCHRQLAYIAGRLPSVAEGAATRANKRLLSAQMQLAAICDRRLRPQAARLDSISRSLEQTSAFAISRARQRLDGMAQLLAALSPQATLKRGYTITRVGGHALASAAQLAPGDTIVTIFADGSAQSVVTNDKQ